MNTNTLKPINKQTKTLKPLTLAIALVIGTFAASALAEDAMDAANNTLQPETYTNDWQSPEVAEFTRLDTTGNGLLLSLIHI